MTLFVGVTLFLIGVTGYYLGFKDGERKERTENCATMCALYLVLFPNSGIGPVECLLSCRNGGFSIERIESSEQDTTEHSI